MDWEKVRLGDISRSIQPGPFGSQLHNSDYADDGAPVIMPKDMVDGKLSHNNLVFVSEEHVNRLKRHQVSSGDLVVARKGDVRKCVYITKNEDGWFIGSDCLKVVLKDDICISKYIYYQLKSEYIGRWLETISIGSTMPSLNTGLLSSIELFLPLLNVQKKIANILSAYDDLIENNQKQIKLLEEAAQRLYKEWFVDMRFPGYETTKIIDGVPEGWGVEQIGSIAKFERGKTITKAQTSEGKIPVVAGGLGPAYYHNKWNAEPPIITISASGANAGFVRLYFTKIWASDCSFVDNKMTEYIYYVYCYLKENKEILSSMQKGSAQPHVYAKDINQMLILIPPDALFQKFTKQVSNLFSLITLLNEQINKLTEARDRLLPKLMSGDIEVKA